ncbi:MAG TPA: hypothetical protein VMR45_00255 [Patescibacteria group bacterium]|nr:hypothetical protein [Patescibacteria group bacterium]
MPESAPAVNVDGSIGAVAAIMNVVAAQHIPETVSLVNGRVGAVDSRIERLRASMTELNRSTIEAQIGHLRTAQYYLVGAVATLGRPGEGVVGRIESFVATTTG